MASPHYDVFLSYHPSDKKWARALLELLRWYELRAFTCEDIQVGESDVARRNEALDAARFFIQIVTPAALVGASWEELEQNTFLVQTLEAPGKKGVLPVILRPATLPVVLSNHNACKLVGKSGLEYRAELSRLLVPLLGVKEPDFVIPHDAPVPNAPESQDLDRHWPALVTLYAGVFCLEPMRHHFADSLQFPNARQALDSLAQRGDPQRGAELAAIRYLLTLDEHALTPRVFLDDLTKNKANLSALNSESYVHVHRALTKLVDPPKTIFTPLGQGKPTDSALTYLPHYLKATREEHYLLPVAGYETEVKVPITLNDVYVSLQARVHRELGAHGHRWGSHLVKNGKNADLIDCDADSEEPYSDRGVVQDTVCLEEAFTLARNTFKLRGLVVVGDPGSGKTTLLKRLLVQCIDGGSESLGLPPDLVPVLLPLRHLRDPAKGLDVFLQDQLATNPHLKLPPDFGEALLERGKLLLLLDGLDEVADEQARVRVRAWIELAHTARPDCYFVITSRYAGYQEKARFDGRFLELNVQSFDDEQAQAFVKQWYTAVEVGLRGDTQHARAQAQEQSTRLWNGLTIEEFRSRKLRELVGNPLLLTILCLVHRVRGSLPKRRVLLYRECVNVLLQHWQQAKELNLGVEGEQARQTLQPVAWWLHEVEGRTRATAAELAPVLDPALRELQVSLTPENFLKTIRDRSGLLVGWDVDSYGFMHLSLQEYLVALEAWSQDRLDEVVAHFGESWWKEVTLLLLGIPERPVFDALMRCLVRTPAFIEHSELVGLCLEDSFKVTATPFLEVLETRDRTDWRRDYACLRAMKGLKDARIVEVCRRVFEKSRDRSVRDLARELLEARGERVSVTLEAGTVWVHEGTGLEFVYVPAGRFKMGSNEHDRERPIHLVTFARGFWIGKYPVTNAQYGRFLAANKTHREPGSLKDSQFNGAEQPVVGVTWNDAKAYCEWADGVLRSDGDLPPADGEMIVLPSEAEWEYAARGPKAWAYPWGNKAPTHELANFDQKVGRTTPVGQYPKGASWVGALDMAGNVLEWCADPWHENYEEAPANGRSWMMNPSLPDWHNKNEKDPMSYRAVRGGGWDNGAVRVRSACRGWGRAGVMDRFWGFRVLAAALPGEDSRAVDT